MKNTNTRIDVWPGSEAGDYCDLGCRTYTAQTKDEWTEEGLFLSGIRLSLLYVYTQDKTECS